MANDNTQPLLIYKEVVGEPYHDFWLRLTSEHAMDDYMSVVRQAALVRIPDALVQYCADSMSWIPTRNPAYTHAPVTMGLHFYGPTIIDQAGAQLFRQVCLAWASLFSAGPAPLILTAGAIDVIRDDGSQEKHWHRLYVDRDVIVQTFQELAHYAEQAASGQFYILHLGV